MKLPPEVASQIPPDAELIKKTTTKLGETYVFQHRVLGWEVDGDREIIKLRKGSPPQVEVVEKTWNEVSPPFPVPPKEKKTIAILINPENPLYIFDTLVPKYHPCFLIPGKEKPANFTIVDAKTGETIGRSVPAP